LFAEPPPLAMKRNLYSSPSTAAILISAGRLVFVLTSSNIDSAASWLYRRLLVRYVSYTPREIAASSPPPVMTNWPFFALTIAVPVSWHIGSTPPAAIDAFFRRSSATKRSLSLASGSRKMSASCCRWLLRKKWAMSRIASAVSRVIALASTRTNSPSDVFSTETPSRVTRRYCVSSSPSGSNSVCAKGSGAVTTPWPPSRRALHAVHVIRGREFRRTHLGRPARE